MKNSRDLVEIFLKDNDININISEYINILKWCCDVDVNISIFDAIIVDAYNGFSEDVKDISNYIHATTGVFLGRQEKIVLKKSLDYGYKNDLDAIIDPKIKKINLKQLVIDHRKDNFQKIVDCKNIFFENLQDAIKNNNKKRVSDYINFLYSKVLKYVEYKNRSIYDIFQDNKVILEKNNSLELLGRFESICIGYKKKLPYMEAVNLFNKLYNDEILNDWNSLSDVVIFKLDQKLFNKFWSKSEFISYCFWLFGKIYSDLNNHRSLVVKIDNIIDNNINIKWELYSYLTIYAENFISYGEKWQYYKSEEICIDYLEHRYWLWNTAENKNKLKGYFEWNLNIWELNSFCGLSLLKGEIDYFKYMYNGFQFVDCIILKSDNCFENTKEIAFIENKNELLLIFVKHQVDDRMIPCPVCASLKISGNSYTSIGIKSWECKNNLCSDRSKTNRWKRYSARSNDMQMWAASNLRSNIISKDLISKWRRDIVSESSYNSLYEMLIRYYSYDWWNVLFLNFEKSNVCSDLNISRNIIFDSVFGVLPIDAYQPNLFIDFIDGALVNKFIYDNEWSQKLKTIKIDDLSSFRIENSDCLSYLKQLPKSSIDGMVTSPPYYNAREYSQWKNLYNYLNDMYKICKSSFDVMVDGGVFFYNIWDIFDNPNTFVKSKMGEKRIALWAYMILAFKKAGFELLDNVIWDKWETQSNRHKNDGNFTPYYQKPANCYEHMFIFKKPWKLRLSITPMIKNNIQKFWPVIKINSKWENLFGHTAPYPVVLPSLSIKTFTKKGDIVFDPFLWSWTSVYVAVNNGRKGLWTELDSLYFDLAAEHIKKNIKN